MLAMQRIVRESQNADCAGASPCLANV